ncbi:hypothetical protein GCM10027085_06100 [Spirosoma aerophilum]
MPIWQIPGVQLSKRFQPLFFYPNNVQKTCDYSQAKPSARMTQPVLFGSQAGHFSDKAREIGRVLLFNQVSDFSDT